MTLDPTSLPSDPTGALGLPALDRTALPADVRKAGAQGQKTYAAALGFEQVLLGELAKAMTATTDLSGNSSGGGDASGGGTSAGADPATSMYSQLLPDQLAQALTGSGGVGVAHELYQAMQQAQPQTQQSSSSAAAKRGGAGGAIA